MKATIVLIIAFIVFFGASTATFLLTNPFDIGAFASLLLTIPFAVSVVFCWKRKPWAYLASIVLAMVLLLATPAALVGSEQISPFDIWQLVMATLLSALIALESFKAYLESKS